MKRLISLLSVAALACALNLDGAAAGGEIPSSPRAQIVFRNGDLLKGSLLGLENGQLRWARADAPEPMDFSTAAIARVEFEPGTSRRGFTNLSCVVRLTNDDQFQGLLQGFDGARLRLETLFAGTLDISASRLLLFMPQPPPRPILYQGPTSMEGWVMGKVSAAAILDSGVWMFKEGALYALKSASVAREVNLPDVASLSFDLEWRGFFHIAIALYTSYLQPINLANKDQEPDFGGFYSLQLNPFSANLLPVKKTEPLRYLGQAGLQGLGQRSSASFDVRINKPKRTITLLMDGVVIKQWVDTEGFAGSGTAIRLVHQGQGAVRVSNLKVAEWDGQFEEPPFVAPDLTVDLARLRNGDRVSGKVRGMDGQSVAMESASQELQVPLARVKQIQMGSGRKEVEPISPRSVRAHLFGGGWITGELAGLDASAVRLESANFGQASIPLADLQKLEFELSPAK